MIISQPVVSHHNYHIVQHWTDGGILLNGRNDGKGPSAASRESLAHLQLMQMFCIRREHGFNKVDICAPVVSILLGLHLVAAHVSADLSVGMQHHNLLLPLTIHWVVQLGWCTEDRTNPVGKPWNACNVDSLYDQ